ncbi:hypothetical protein K440DRAFT_625190 [Wilcoxina mikolae CBS 423.85]|nr:hypothetical protein K440DRAFT_625190 [Wilcoxina mikolae CBS 423.85]
MTKHPPTGIVVLWTGRFHGDNYEQPKTNETLAVLIPRSEVATLQDAKMTFGKRIKWFHDAEVTTRHSKPTLCRIKTNCVAYGDHLSDIDEKDWGMLCGMDAFDHIYVEATTLLLPLNYDIRVSLGPWKVDKT